MRASLKDEVLKIMPLQKQTHSGQWTRLKRLVLFIDYNGHINPGVKDTKNAATILGTMMLAKLGEQDLKTPYCPLQGGRMLWFCAGAPHPS